MQIDGPAARPEEVKRRCRPVLRARAAARAAVETETAILHEVGQPTHTEADPTVALG